MISKLKNDLIEVDSLVCMHEFNISPDTREIWLHAPYEGIEDEIDYRTAITFCKNILYLNKKSTKKKIVIHLHSMGGDWVYGMSIYDAIKNSTAPTVVIGHSAVCSMATVIMKAGTERYITPNSDFMIHFGSFAVSSDTVSAMSDAEQNQRDTQKMLMILAHRASKTIPSTPYAKHMKFIKDSTSKAGNWWMPAHKAVEYGFVDGIIDNETIKPSDIKK